MPGRSPQGRDPGGPWGDRVVEARPCRGEKREPLSLSTTCPEQSLFLIPKPYTLPTTGTAGESTSVQNRCCLLPQWSQSFSGPPETSSDPGRYRLTPGARGSHSLIVLEAHGLLELTPGHHRTETNPGEGLRYTRRGCGHEILQSKSPPPAWCKPHVTCSAAEYREP
jgi:hypothetical protein